MPDHAKYLLVFAVILIAGSHAFARNLTVGPGKQFARIEQANAAARPGDVILVYPMPGEQGYPRTSVFVRQRNITFRAVPARGQTRVKISGKGFDYSGRGSTPRAIFQFNRGTDNCILEGFELTGAHNQSHNGAGVRINQANNVTVRGCDIHHNDMGIMSNGDGTLSTGVNQRIENCHLHHNGDFTRPGYNHNLYLGGTSVTLSGCDVHHSLTGHNVKSRAHHTRVEYSYIHHSANREFDLVDAADTARPESHAVLLGNVIVKDPKCKGNKTVIHFGQDGGRGHDGTIYLAFNTIVTPFISPLVDLSTAQAKAQLTGNIVTDGGSRQNNQKIVHARSGANMKNVTGRFNLFSGGFSSAGTGLDLKTNVLRRLGVPLFIAPAKGDYRLSPQLAPQLRTGLKVDQLKLPAVPGAAKNKVEQPLSWQYKHPAGREKRDRNKPLTLGAYAR